MPERRITVYASSSARTPEPYLAAARRLGREFAARRWVLVTGAGNTGCMGAANRACLEAGGRVEGVILRRFHEDGLGCDDLHALAVTETMRERKRLLGEGSDAYLALPGGPGTFEEFWELAVERQIGLHARPLVLLNESGFYDGFLTQIERAERDGLLYGPVSDLFAVADDIPAALARLSPDPS